MKDKQPASEIMFQVETLPQSMVEVKTIVLKPRLDPGDIELIGEKIKSRLFSKFGFKPRPENVQLLYSEIFFEPYLIIGGKYVLDYCKRHVFEVDVDKRTRKVFVAGQEFCSEQSHPNAQKRRIIKMIGEEHSHYERRAYFILDRMMREISPEKLPIAPFEIQRKKSKQKPNFRRLYIPDEAQIEFLKTKIAERPADIAEIIKENFNITERTIAYYPIYELTFENMKNRKVATITINGITGEVIAKGVQKIADKTIVTFPINETLQSAKTKKHQYEQTQTVCNVPSIEPTKNAHILPEDHVDDQSISHIAEENNILGFPAKINGDIFVEGDDVIAVVGDVDVPANTIMDKALVVKGSLTIGNCCITHGKLKAVRDITIGADVLVEGDLFSEGNIIVGPRSVITGTLQATGSIKICGEATIEGGLRTSHDLQVSSDVPFELNA
jgi:hypothetical protein